jgi:O-antigen/teichoic acid export membrane protein
LVLLASMALRMAAGLGLTFMMGRFLSAAEFGAFALVSTAFGLAREFTELGTGSVVVRAAARDPRQERAALEGLLGLRLVLCGIAAAACAAFAVARPQGSERAVLLATAAVLVASHVSALAVAFQLRQGQFWPSVLNVLVQVGAVAAAALMLTLGADGGWFPGVVVAREAIALLGVTYLAVRLLGYFPRPQFSRASWRRFTGSAAVVALATLAYNFQLLGGVFWVQYLRPEAELGAFGAAQRPLASLLIIPWLLMSPLVPVMSYLAGRDRAEFRGQARAAIDLSIGLGAVIAVATERTAEPLLQVLYGAKFSVGPLAADATLRWFALPVGLSFIAAAVGTALVADFRERALLAVGALGCVIHAVLNVALLPQVGFDGSAEATAASVCVTTLGAMIVVGARGITPSFRSLLVLAPAAALYFVLPLLPDSPAPRLYLAAPLSLVALLAVWRFPGLPESRAAQARLTRHMLSGHE